jgi:hypothetical protein
MTSFPYNRVGLLTVTSGHEIASMFQRMVNKRLLPDYFDVIKEPVAFSTIRVCRLIGRFADHTKLTLIPEQNTQEAL